ncbi:MAG TPA: glyoxalase superfamily protein [Candidatus Cybelea sp.]|jgi:catechol 2,3-dioxygenase-like lactoylglutathione lyase family enzyme
MGRVVPILRILDVAKAKDFYCGFLGFQIDWEHYFAANLPLYAQISRDDAVLHLSEHFGDGTFGAHIRIETPGLRAYQEALLEKQYRHSRPGLRKQEWGEISMAIADPLGNVVTFYETLPKEA